MSVSVDAETEAPDLHDLVTKRDPDGFAWDHQFTVSDNSINNQRRIKEGLINIQSTRHSSSSQFDKKRLPF